MIAWVRSVGRENGIVAASCQSAFLVVKEVESIDRHEKQLKGNPRKRILGQKNASAHLSSCEVYQYLQRVYQYLQRVSCGV
ncbi:hypothetical protein RHMOL_Rhmol04G0198600 [Rhododendron molle]|uniref:Uncharacterized protein n=1 Tax=Rhododendron molle TaxID=49168 RepID=A0ACC0P2M6_RHOML|nr:hypothetical protein RHMOL_Rhmol04G0198600 [Rhododendron molle]